MLNRNLSLFVLALMATNFVTQANTFPACNVGIGTTSPAVVCLPTPFAKGVTKAIQPKASQVSESTPISRRREVAR